MPDFRETVDFEFTSEPASCESVRRLVRNLLTREPSQRLRSLLMLQRHGFYHHFDFDALKLQKVSAEKIVHESSIPKINSLVPDKDDH